MSETKRCTLCLLLDEDRVLLGNKRRGFGAGKWNGFGGKVEAGETIARAAVREVEEESGVRVREEDLLQVAEIDFIFQDEPGHNNHTSVYLCRSWQGEPKNTEEMVPQWFAKDGLPFAKMWSCDAEWIPLVLSGRKIRARIYFTAGDIFSRADIADLI